MSKNSYEYLEDVVNFGYSLGSGSPDESERLGILKEGQAEGLKEERSIRGEGTEASMRAVF